MNSLTPITDTFVEEFDIDNGPQNYRAVPEEICRKLEIKYNELLAWKAEALIVESEWDEQALAKLLGAPLGVSCRKFIAREVPKLLEENTRLRQQLLSSSVKTSDKI